MSRGSDLGRRYDIPPKPDGATAELLVSTDGARIVRRRTGEKLLTVRIRFDLENILDGPVTFDPDATTLVDSRQVVFPVRHVSSIGLDKDASLGAGEKGVVDVYFEIGPPVMISEMSGFTLNWSYAFGGTSYPGQTSFVRFTPSAGRDRDPWQDAFDVGSKWWSGSRGGAGLHHGSSSRGWLSP